MHQSQVEAVIAAVATIDDVEFTEYPGGWPNQVGTALVDAVFSIRAKYEAKDPTKGVIGRLRTFNQQQPETTNDLQALVGLGEATIRDVMGDTKTSGRLKSECVVEAAGALLALEPPVRTAEDLRGADLQTVRAAYTSVRGLGWVTCEYFLMLLGVPGVKADRMIVRFVNEALTAANLDPVDARGARQLVEDAFKDTPRGASLTHYEHAIWRAKGEVRDVGDLAPAE